MYILVIIVDDNCYLYPYSNKDIGKCEFNKILDYLNPPDKEWHKDIQYYKGDKIELIKKYWDDIADMYYDYISLEDVNPFIDPEGFFVYIMVEYAESLMNEVVITSDNFTLDTEHIEYIKKELSE